MAAMEKTRREHLKSALYLRLKKRKVFKVLQKNKKEISLVCFRGSERRFCFGRGSDDSSIF